MGSIMQMFALLFMVALSFVFHLIVWEDDYVKKWYWKVLGGGAVLLLGFAAILGY
tara:strand:+ start:375 stop:539 length:165 start_codon:yes stop_codon:yes gene_type:complete